ncbi:MAG: hypothetical protein J2P54_11935 [Bradyrhizobiaceae bacterium]|nr:hypothetical protein [Bradyrhizobiaceae bacterium]
MRHNEAGDVRYNERGTARAVSLGAAVAALVMQVHAANKDVAIGSSRRG